LDQKFELNHKFSTSFLLQFLPSRLSLQAKDKSPKIYNHNSRLYNVSRIGAIAWRAQHGAQSLQPPSVAGCACHFVYSELLKILKEFDGMSYTVRCAQLTIMLGYACHAQ